MTSSALPPLPLDAWRPTKDTLHLWAQVVGKVRLALAPPRNHWWHVPLYLHVDGITTGLLTQGATTFEIVINLADDRLDVRVRRGPRTGFPLSDGLSVAAFHAGVVEALGAIGVSVAMHAAPYGVPMHTPFAEDREHHSYDGGAARAWWDAVQWSRDVLEEFAGWFAGKTSPVHLFWHSLDLAVTRFDGRRAPGPPPADPVAAEAYSHRVISFGFWAGDDVTPFPAYYAYAAPEPDGLPEQPLTPAEARWQVGPTGALALLPYDAVRTATAPRGALLEFLESTYRTAARMAGWDAEALRSSWAPPHAPGPRG